MADNFVLYSGWAFGLISLVGSLIGIYYAVKAHRRQPLKALELRQEESNLMFFPQNDDAYKFKLNGGDVVGRLTRTRLLLKNIGNTGIEPSDLRPGTKATIAFEIKDGSLLGAYVTVKGSEKPRAKLSVAQDGNVVTLKWDYFDPQDEFSIAAYDTGYARSIKLKGDFKSGVVISNSEKNEDSKIKTAAGIALFIAVLIIYAGLVGAVAIVFSEMSAFHFAQKATLREIFYVGIVASVSVLLSGVGALFLMERLTKIARKYAAKIKTKISAN